MRNAFISELFSKAKSDEKIMLLTGDLGYGVLDNFKAELPKQFINAGVAEQLMTGLAAGLAFEGYKPFTYSIANFSTLRCLEQIRNDICYHNLNVKIISLGAGVSYGTHGYTHYALEDIAIMRSLPNIQILSPADPIEARAVVHAALFLDRPTYIRLGKNGEPNIHKPESCLDLLKPKAIELLEGSELYILSTGAIANEAYKAVQKWNESNLVKVGFATLPWLKPFDQEFLLKLKTKKTTKIITVEEHIESGGLSTILFENCNSINYRPQIIPHALPSKIEAISPQEDLWRIYGLNTEGILKLIQKIQS